MRRALARALRLRWPLPLLAACAVLVPTAQARAQLFFASRPDPAFTIGPLIIRASVTEAPGPVAVTVLWSLIAAPNRSAQDIAQDLYLLWPGELQEGATGAKPDATLSRYVEERGFGVVGEGRLGLFAQSLSESGRASAEPQPGGAPFAVFVQEDGTRGLSPPATLIRIPWTPRLADRGWLVELRMKVPGLIKPRKATWAERLFVGQRYVLTMSFNEVRDRPLFPMYFQHRDRVVRLADAPSEMVANFSHSDHLKIDQVFPPTSIRRLSETQESTEVVSLFLDKSEGITPQHLSVQFGYFSRVQAWALVLIPTLFFVLGQAMGPVIGRTSLRIFNALAARVHVGGWNATPRKRESGVIIPREVLHKIVPGETTQEQVIRLCGPEMEQFEQFPALERRTLVYRGRRLVPKARRVFGWLSTVGHWEVERHEVRIELERDVVRDIQAQTRCYRLAAEEPD